MMELLPISVGIGLAISLLFTEMFGIAAGGTYLARGALAAVRRSDESDNAILLARFFAENIATAAPGLAETVMGGAEVLLGVRGEQLAH